MSVTKTEIVDNLVKKCDLDKKSAKLFVERFFEKIIETLASGEDVRLSGFGNFMLRDKKPRPGRNPKTGESALISARRVVVFKAGQKWRERVQHNVK